MALPNQLGFFDLARRYEALSHQGDPLERLAQHIPGLTFGNRWKNGCAAPSGRRAGGRPPFDAVLMFKVLVLQALYNLSDEQTEYQIRDRLSFMRF
ncbi:MAG: transposase, partial [Nitrospirales bacterium]|nr:transposase [Nitrospirales bacterium]